MVNVEKLQKMVIFQNLSKNGEMLKKMLVKTLKKLFAVIFFYTMDIKNTIFNPKFYQHFLPPLLIKNKRLERESYFLHIRTIWKLLVTRQIHNNILIWL